MTENNFEFSIGSDTDFENLIADIGIENHLVALLTQEEGFENMKIRIFPSKNEDFWEFRLDEFEKIINQAKYRLWELRRIPEDE